MKLSKALAVGLLLSTMIWRVSAQVNITTWQVNPQHTGNNASETILTPGNVGSPGNFGLLFSQPLDGQTYGQPLLMSGVSVNGTTHNVVYVATQHGSLYAYDADNNTAGNANALWSVALLPTGTVPVPQSVVGSSDIPVELGITTTPVIDPASRTIYIVSKVQRTADTTYHQYLYALDLATGAAKFNSPVEINPTFPGTANDAVNKVIPFSALHEHLRCAMALSNGVVYLAYASHSDTTPYHGEVIGYDATTLQVVKTFNTTPNGTNPEGGIWQSGASPAFDTGGNLFLAVGNGAWDQNNASYGTNWGESFLKMSTSGALSVAYSNSLNWFTPNNWKTLNNGDLDLGSGGLTLLPDQSGPHTHIMVGGGKGAVLYVVDRDNLGGLNTPDNAVQEIAEPGGNWLFSTPAYFNGAIYYSAAGGALEQRAVGYNPVDGSYVAATPITSTDTFNNKGSGCFISSNGTGNGLVWILTGSGVRVYNAASVAGSPILSANATLPGNVSCQNTKFSLPIVANGKLYFTGYSGTNTGHLLVYGLLPTAAGAPASPSDATAQGTSAKTVAVNWTSHSTNESGFKIRRSTSATGTFTQVGTAGAGVTAYTDGGLSPATTYYYQVAATNSAGDSNFTNVASARTFPSYVENGLVAYWNLDETGSNTAADTTANAHTGTINGEYDRAPGLINYAVNLHGTGNATSNIAVPNKADLQFAATGSFTLAAWVYPSALRNSEEAIIAKSRDTGNYYGIWINAANQWVCRGPGGDVVGPAVTQSAWAHVAMVQDGTAKTRTLYVNGKAVASGAAQAADGAGALWMGQQNLSGTPDSFPGMLDEVRLYSRALAVGEITNLMGPPVLEAHSNQTHGSAGTFGYTVWPSLTKLIEPRKGATAGTYSLVLNFSAPVSGLTATLKTQSGGAAVGNVGTVSYDATGKVVTVSLSGVGNAQSLFLHLAGIAPGGGTADVPFNVLWGDVNADNVANFIDTRVVQKTHATQVDGMHFLYDLNCDGVINAADDALASAAAGTSLGAQTDTNLAFYGDSGESSDNGAGTTSFYAFDNNVTTTRWESVHGADPQYIYVDLGATGTVHSVILNWENAAGKDYTIDVSTTDTNTWTPIATVTGNTSTGTALPAYTGFNVPARYVRVRGTARTTIYGYSLYDFEVIGQSSTTGTTAAPTVNSAATATGTVGSAFSYQIAATNSPTSYNATGLPAGLSVNTGTGVISGTPTQAGTSNVTLSAANTGGTGTLTLTLTVQTPYAAWQGTYFTAAELKDSNVSGPQANPAGDGISNLMKYALNLNPKVNGAAGLPKVSMTTTGGQIYLTLTYTKVLAATDLTYTPEVSGDLQAWAAGSSLVTVSATNNADGTTQTVVVRDATAASGTGRRFIHLKVTQP